MITTRRLLLPLIVGLSASPSGLTTPGVVSGESRRSDGPCASEVTRATEYHYTVSGRARPLLVWTGRRDVGAATVERTANAANGERIALVIGTDPARAPMRMNRWGYTSESRCGTRTDVVGLMTQSDEKTIDEATVSIAAGDASRPYRAIRATIDGASARTEALRVNAPSERTYRDAASILEALPVGRATRAIAVPAGASPGFLFAVDAALQRAAASPDGASTTLSYVYGLHAYDLSAVVVGRPAALAVGGRTYARTVAVDFLVRNRSTGERTEFQITAGTSGDVTGVPLRVVYRPRWWLELELQLAGDRP